MDTDKELVDINWSEPFGAANDTTAVSVPDVYLQCLQNSFGHSRFRAMQWKVISSILDDARDNCVIMTTGYGKSLCYQFPSVYLNTITIVVSPLISLMQDQVLAMEFYNLRACFLGSAQMKKETAQEVIDLQYNIVYVTPEYITSCAGTSLLERIRENLTLIAIDEAHCISKWGHDFRLAYRSLSRLRDQCPTVPILAMTATATTQVRDDIIESLQLRNAQVLSTGFDRPNLKFMVKLKTDIWADIGPLIKSVKIGSVIVYCISRRITEEVAAVIAAHGQLCGIYHAGLKLDQRQKTHDDFIHDRIRVVVATIAFGMGINKPDVRLVIHYGVAKDVEGYYQEVGRAGRDGLPAKCLMLYRKQDWTIHRLIRKKSSLNASKEHMEELLNAMVEYVGTTQCRRKFILKYFGEDCSKLSARPDCCDNCQRICRTGPDQTINLFRKYQGLDEDGLLDITDESYKLLSLLQDMAYNYGLLKAFLVLRGSKSKQLPHSYKNHLLFASLKDKSEKWLHAVANSLIRIQMLTVITITNKFSSYSHSRCTITSKGRAWLSGIIKRNPIKVVPSEEFIRLLKPKLLGVPKILLPKFEKSTKIQPSTLTAAGSSSTMTATASTSSTPDIYRPLLKVRSQLASLFEVMPYLVASTRALQQLALIQPTTMDELRNIRLDGYSEEKTVRFGPVFLKVIKNFHAQFGKKVTLGQQTSYKPTEIAAQKPSPVNSESNFEACTKTPLSSSNEEITVISYDETIPQRDSNPSTVIISEDEVEDETLESTQESVEIIEPSLPPLIEIDSDIEEAIFANWESDIDDNEIPQVNVKVEKQPNDIIHPKDFENSELDLLIEALQSEDLIEKQEDTKAARIVGKTSSTGFNYDSYTDSNSHIFDRDWDLDIDESDLTQVSELVEQKFNESIREYACKATTPSVLPTEVKPELDLSIAGVRLDPNQNSNIRKEIKPRIIEKKFSEIFEYEDDSGSESETDTKLVISPKKRVMPSWMQPSNKRKR